MRHRPIGIGVQGLADTFLLLGLPFDSPEAAALNSEIFETIYYAALRTSARLAKLHGTYESYEGEREFFFACVCACFLLLLLLGRPLIKTPPPP